MGFEWDYENIVCLMCVLSNFVPICYRLAFFSKLASDSIVFFFKNFFLMYFTQHKLRQFFLRSCFFDVFFFNIFGRGLRVLRIYPVLSQSQSTSFLRHLFEKIVTMFLNYILS